MTPPTPSETSALQPAQFPPASARHSVRRQLFWLAAGVILVSGCLVALVLSYLRSQAIHSGERLTESFAQVIEEQTDRTFQTVDQRLQLAASSLAQLAASGGLNEKSAHALLREQVKELPFVRAMWVMDTQGRIIYDSDVGNIGVNLADRAFFQIYRTQPQTTFNIGIPVLSRMTGTWQISATRPLQASNGSFAGIIVAAVEPLYFDNLWRTVELGTGGSIALLRRDGVLMMRSPFDAAVMGKSFQDRPLFRVHLSKSPAGSYLDASAIDGTVRMFAYRTLSAQPDLVVVVGESYEVVLAPWRQLAILALAIWAAASVAITLLCVLLNRAWQQRISMEADVEQMAQRLTLATDAAAIAVWDWNLITNQWYATPTYFTMLGYDPDEGFGGRKRWLARIHPQDRDAVDGKIQAVLTGTDAPYHYEARMRHADGSFRWISVIGRVLARDDNGQASRLLGVMVDITERKQAEQQILAGQESLRESALHTQTILDNLMDGVITINAQGLVESFNKAASTVFGYAPEEVLGRNVAMLMPEPYRSQHDGYLQHYHSTGQERIIGMQRELEGQRQDGSAFPMSLSVSRISRTEKTTFIGIVRDITQHRQDVEEIRRLAFYDPLTGLPNRRLLMDRLKHAMVTSERTGQHGAVMFLDLDHFKRLNDTLGHDLGDVLLQQVASRLKACVREGDSVARLGGDEFVVLLEALSIHAHEAAAQAEVVADKILDTLGQAYSLRGHSCASTPSIGIVVFMEHHETMDDLLKKADVAMYQAKSAGRNTARFFDPVMQAAVAAHAGLEKEMRRDLAQHEFVLHYQIQVDSNGAPIGAEALVRWNHATRGMVAPAHFIPLAEETGMILPLGQWVLETACAQLVTWASDPETAQWTMAVNVSALQFSKADFVSTVATALEKTGANPCLLKLELTESTLVADVEDIIVRMNEIKAQGVGFSLDDFGTGYSSLSHLKRLPLDQLKIDKSFVRDVLTDANDAVIARTVVALGHSLGLKVIAEGVETLDQRDFLADIGCDAFQGFYFGRPAPASALAGTSSKYLL